MLIARFDGGCWPNPSGHAACACLVTKSDGYEIHRESKYLGSGALMSNNVAEFEGLLLIIRWFNATVKEHKENITIIGDSRVVINRMKHGQKAVSDGGRRFFPSSGVCARISFDCLLAASWNRHRMKFQWESRDNNDECDAMCRILLMNKKSEHEAFLDALERE